MRLGDGLFRAGGSKCAFAESMLEQGGTLFGGPSFLQDGCHFGIFDCGFLHEGMLQMFQMYGIFGGVKQMFSTVFRYFTHICTRKFSHLFSVKGKTKKYSMI